MGSLLAPAYAATHLERAQALLLRGIFLGTDRELGAYLRDFPGRAPNEPARACIGRLHREFENGRLETRAEIATAGHGQFDLRIVAASLAALERLQVRPGNGGWTKARQEGPGERAG